jgi:hypothetical protein
VSDRGGERQDNACYGRQVQVDRSGWQSLVPTCSASGVGELVEDGQGLLPGVAGGLRVSGGVVGVAEAGEGVGFVVAVADLPVELDRLLVAGEGLGVLAELVVGIA